MRLQLVGVIGRSWWHGLKHDMRSLSKSPAEQKGLAKGAIDVPVPSRLGD